MGLIALILIFPTVGFGIVRLRTTVPHPPPAAFAGIKPQIALAKSPQRIYLISGQFTQLSLALGQFAFIQSFSTLRSISLCIVDAVLTAPTVAGLMGFVLMIQIISTGLIGIRAWLEQHIAKREAASGEKLGAAESGELTRKDPPPPLDLAKSRPLLVQRKTEDLEGFEDGAISAPFNVRKEGDVLSPHDDVLEGTRPTYKFFPSERNVIREDYNGRASSDIFDPLDSPRPPIINPGPKTAGVTTADLFPPPPNPPQLTQTSRDSSYSQPFAGNRPSRDAFMGFDGPDGFGRGPGGTVKDRDRRGH